MPLGLWPAFHPSPLQSPCFAPNHWRSFLDLKISLERLHRVYLWFCRSIPFFVIGFATRTEARNMPIKHHAEVRSSCKLERMFRTTSMPGMFKHLLMTKRSHLRQLAVRFCDKNFGPKLHTKPCSSLWKQFMPPMQGSIPALGGKFVFPPIICRWHV